MDHLYCYHTSSFIGVNDKGVAPQKMIVNQIYEVAIRRMAWLANVGQTQCDDPTNTFRMKKFNILFILEYWKVSIFVLFAYVHL
jgi:hypothetical protein